MTVRGAVRSLSAEEFREILKSKRWTVSDAAWRWGVSREHLSRVVSDPGRDCRWNDLIQALPVLTARERREMRLARMSERPSPRRPVRPAEQAAPAQLTPGSMRTSDTILDELEEDYGPVRPAPGRGVRYHGLLVKGSELVALEDVGDFVAEGEYVWVRSTRLGEADYGGAIESYELTDGVCTHWADPDEIDRFWAETGRQIGENGP